MNSTIQSLIQFYSKQGPVLLLESQSRHHPWSQRSFFAANPQAQIKAHGNDIWIVESGQERNIQGNPWEALAAFRQRYGDWLFGYLGYDLKNHTEELYSKNDDPVGAPDMWFMVPELLVEWDKGKENCSIIKGDMPEELFPKTGQVNTFSIHEFAPKVSPETYIAKIKEAQHRIREGDFYEINLSHQSKGQFEGDPFGLYNRMKKVGPVPFGAYMNFEELSVCCQSPERFLRKEGSHVFSQPIKGTAQRGESKHEDEFLKQQLIGSPKEKAENLMIVDLVRNDLSKIACKGSVRVPKLFDIETFGTVHQMVSTITAEAAEDDPISVLQACFPMGSMTGAPKISAMQNIEELEEYHRGIYSGAVGYIQPNGDFDFNVVIRTAIIKNGELFYSAGGAITSDSDPQKEWQETLLKTKALQDTLMDYAP